MAARAPLICDDSSLVYQKRSVVEEKLMDEAIRARRSTYSNTSVSANQFQDQDCSTQAKRPVLGINSI